MCDPAALTAHVSDRTVSVSDEIVDHQAHAQLVVVADVIRTQSLALSRSDHHGHIAGGVDQRFSIEYGADDENRIDTQSSQRADRLADDSVTGRTRRRDRSAGQYRAEP